MTDKNDTANNEFTTNKKLTSNLNYFTQVIIFIIISAVTGWACFNFGYGRMGWEGGAIAACISLVLFGAYLRNNRKHNKWNSFIEWFLILFFIAFEILVIGANFMTQAEKKPNIKIEEKRQAIKSELVRLKAIHIDNPKSNTDKYDNRLNSEKISLEKAKLDKLPNYQNNENKFFESAALLLGISSDIVKLIFNVSIGGLLTIGGAMTGTRINSYTCHYLIKKQIDIQGKINKLITAGIESDEPASGVNTRTQTSTAHAHGDNFDSNVQKMVSYLSAKADGYKVTEKVIKAETQATTAQVKQIRSQLKTQGWIVKGGNGAAAQYKKSTPAQQESKVSWLKFSKK